MSGIFGILNFDDAPVEPQLMRRMTDFMAFRGPDAQETWVDGNVGLGHAMLRTTDESLRERQPFSLTTTFGLSPMRGLMAETISCAISKPEVAAISKTPLTSN